MRRTFQLTAVSAAAVLLAACDFEGNTTRFTDDFHSTHPLKARGHVSLETMNGSVEVIGWDQDQVEVSGVKYASSESAMRAIQIDVVSTPESIRIRTIPPSGHRNGVGARYTIHVPRTAEIERITSSNGKIQIDEIETASLLRTSNGSVKVSGTKGPLEVVTSNASVELNKHDGAAVVHTSNGSIRADQVRGNFEALTSNASINARILGLEPGRPLKLVSSNGSITLALENLQDNDIRAVTSNASITLRLPSASGAQLRAHTSNSSVNSDFPMTVSGAASRNSLEGTIGAGGPAIDLSTSNGPIRVQKL